MKNIKKYSFTILLFSLVVLSATGVSAQKLQSLNERGGLPNFFEKAQKGQPLTVVYFGGSITNHQGYRVFSEEWLRSHYPNNKITTVNAGVGGTGSDLGVFRMDDDVLVHNPDLVFVEFAVNDGGTDSLIICNSMEGIVRKIRRTLPNTDICFLYTVGENMLPDIQSGCLFRSMRFMESIADHYHIPSINFAVDVVAGVESGTLLFRGEKGVSYPDKAVFSDDGVHPSFDVGHRIYTKTLTESLVAMERSTSRPVKYEIVKPLYATNFEKAKTVSLSELKTSGGWKKVPSDDKIYKYYQGSSVKFPDLICSSDPADFVELKFRGEVVGVFDVIGPSSGDFTYSIDGAQAVNVRSCFNLY